MPDASLDPAPESLVCAVCGGEVTDVGYLPATDGEDDYRPHPDDTVCGTCGFSEVGMMGCAPALDDVAEAADADVLLYVERLEEGFEVRSVKG
jgi:hypothetical protein